MLTCADYDPDGDSYVWFTGRGLEHFLVCQGCADRWPQPPAALVEAAEFPDPCESAFSFSGVRGTPEVLSRPTSLCFETREVTSPIPEGEHLADVIPDGSEGEAWLCLTASGILFRAWLSRGVVETVCHFADPGFPLDDETVLLRSQGGGYGAVVRSSGQFGFVFELATGRITCRLDRGPYRPENSCFPVAFFESAGRTLFVAATAWNRLDILEPATGSVLTTRELSPSSGEPPGRNLDYFHAGLLVSPDQYWIVDNGWVWSPVGVVRLWNLADWLRNPWESENGRTVRELAVRAYFWDGPICWIDESTVAVWGWGGDDEWLVPAVRLFDAATGHELRWFAGPSVRAPRCWPPTKVARSLFFDEFLFAVNETTGTTVWDVATGERLLHDATLTPVQYHRGSREFLSRTAEGFRLSRLAR